MASLSLNSSTSDFRAASLSLTSEYGNLWFDLLKHRPERPPHEDLWAGFHTISEMDRKN